MKRGPSPQGQRQCSSDSSSSTSPAPAVALDDSAGPLECLTAYNGQPHQAALASVIPAVRLRLAALSQKLSYQFRVQATLQLAELVGHAATLVPPSGMAQGLQHLATREAFKAT